MLSCYIKNYFKPDDQIGYYTILMTLLIKLLILIYLIYLGISVYKNKVVQKKKHFKRFFLKYLVYGFIFILFNIPTMVLYFITLNKTIYSPSFQSYLSFFSAISSITIDFCLCLVNILFGQVKLISITGEVYNF